MNEFKKSCGGIIMETNGLERKEILDNLVDALKPLNYVYAMWQCGSAAFERVDQWSDIDVVVDVEDDRVKDIFEFTDKALQVLSPIEYTYECPQIMSPGAYQKVYRLKNTSEFLVVEVCAVKHSSNNKFLHKEIHGDVFVHFDKKNVTEVKPIDKEKMVEKLILRIQQIEKLFNIYQFLIKKELNRSNDIEALEYYRNFSVNPLLELLRIRYCPYRYSFKTRYIYYDLPKDIVNKLHPFYYIKDGVDLGLKHKEVINWFNETINELKGVNLEELL